MVEGVLGWSYRWIFMHPEHPLFETLEIPPMRVLAESAKDLIEMAGKMRMALDAGWKPRSGGAATENPIGPNGSAEIGPSRE